MADSTAPRTAKDALIAEMMGDLDAILDRVQAMKAGMDQTVSALAEADDKYRLAVTAFTEQAKAELSDYLDNKATQSVEIQTMYLQEAIRRILQENGPNDSATLALILKQTAPKPQDSRLKGALINAGISCIGAACGVLIVMAILGNLPGIPTLIH